jgi:hypothetical protein
MRADGEEDMPAIRPRLLLAFISLLVAGRVSAGPISVTSGYVDLRLSAGPLLLAGDRGFTYDTRVGRSSGLFFALNCNDNPPRCLPGSTLNLGIYVDASDIGGNATLDGVTYGHVGGANSPNFIVIETTGSLVLPALAPTAVATAPFTLTGTFTHAVGGEPFPEQTRESLTGSGTVTVSLVADQNYPGSWRVTGLFYSLNHDLPVDWLSADLGAVGQPGSAVFSNDSFAIRGSGADIWGTADAFRFLYQPLPSDGEIIARIDTLTNTNPYAKAGLMLRQSEDASSAHVVLDVKPDTGVEFMTRSTSGGSTSFVAGATQPFPVWLKLTRTATTITGSISTDGRAWTTVGSTDLPTTPLLAGMVVTSHDTSVTAESLVAQVSMRASTLPSPWSVTDVGDVGTAGSASFASSSFTIQGAGADIWSTADAFTFMFQAVSGDAQVTTQIKSLDNSDPYAKAGVMIRTSLDPSSPHVILDVKPGGQIELMTRGASGGETAFIATTMVSFPVSLRLARTGAVITGFILNGSDWIPVGSVNASLGSAVLAGLAVTSHRAGTLTTAVFGSTTVDAGAGAFQSQDIGAVGIAGGVVSSNYSLYTVAGAGADIWGTSDSFQYAYKHGDFAQCCTNHVFVFGARLVSLQNTNPFAKAGIMIRESLSVDAAHILLDVKPTGEIEFMVRPSAGAPTQFISTATVSTPVYLRLTIDDATTVTAWIGTTPNDPNQLVPIGSATVPVGSWASPLAGLAVTSHDPSQLNIAVFDHTP